MAIDLAISAASDVGWSGVSIFYDAQLVVDVVLAKSSPVWQLLPLILNVPNSLSSVDGSLFWIRRKFNMSVHSFAEWAFNFLLSGVLSFVRLPSLWLSIFF